MCEISQLRHEEKKTDNGPDTAGPTPNDRFSEFCAAKEEGEQAQDQGDDRSVYHGTETLPIELGPLAGGAATKDGDHAAEPEDSDRKLGKKFESIGSPQRSVPSIDSGRLTKGVVSGVRSIPDTTR